MSAEERFIPKDNAADTIYHEHFVRYLFAKQFVKDKIVLDAGCGSGYGTQLLSQAGAKTIYGIDKSIEAIEYAKTNHQSPQTIFQIDNVLKLSFPENFFEVIVSFEVLEHLPDPHAFIQELKRVLKPDGLVILSVPNKTRSEQLFHHNNPFHFNEMTEDEFTKLIQTHFPVYKIFKQQAYLGNAITADGAINYGTDHHFGPLNHPVCFLTLASPTAIPASCAPAGFFSDDTFLAQRCRENLKIWSQIQESHKENLNLWQQNQSLWSQIQELQKYIKRIHDSPFWKLTKPLRALNRKLKFENSILISKFAHYTEKIQQIGLKKAMVQWLERKSRRWRDKLGKKIFTPTEKKTIVPQTDWPAGRPLISVVVPCYNYGRFLPELLESLEQQTYKDFETIIVDDGSTEQQTLEFYKTLNFDKCRLIRQTNQGLARSRNNGIQQASVKYICCIDADDKIAPTYLEKCAAALEAEPSVGFVYSWVQLFGDEEYVWQTEEFDLKKELYANHVSVAAVFRKDAWERAGGYNPNMDTGYEDWNFWLSLGKLGWAGRCIPEPLFLHRRHGKTMTHRAHQDHARLTQIIKENHPQLFQNTALLKQLAQTKKTYYAADWAKNLYRRQTPNQDSILFIVPQASGGGAEKVMDHICEASRGISLQPYIFTTEKNAYNDEQLDIYHLNHFLREDDWLEFILRFNETHRVKHIIISGSRYGLANFPRLKNPNWRSHILAHNTYQPNTRPILENRELLDSLIAVSHSLKNYFAEQGVDADKISVIHNGISLDYFNADSFNKKGIRKFHGIPDDACVIGFLGRLSQEKGVYPLVQIIQTFKRSTANFVIIGDGPLETTIYKEGKNNPNARHYGLQEDPRPYLAMMDMLIMPSEMEGLPFAALEALAMGTPVIAFDVGGMSEIIQSGVNGQLIPPGDTAQFIKALDVCVKNPQTLYSMRQNARDSVQKFSKQKMIQSYQALFRA